MSEDVQATLARLHDLVVDCYQQALPSARAALELSRPHLAESHLASIAALSNLATLSFTPGDYEQAEPLLQQTLTLQQQTPGLQHPDGLTTMHTPASLCYATGDYEQAETLYQQVLASRQDLPGEQHPEVATSLSNLAELAATPGAYDRALAIMEAAWGLLPPRTAKTLSNLAVLNATMGDSLQAEHRHRLALTTATSAPLPVSWPEQQGMDIRRVRALGTVPRLFLAADGDPTRLSFEVPPTDDGGRLLDSYRIRYPGSGRDLLRAPGQQRREESERTPAEHSAPLFARLTGTRREGERVADLLGVSSVPGEQALEARIKASRSPRLLHIATHGFFLPDQPARQERDAFRPGPGWRQHLEAGPAAAGGGGGCRRPGPAGHRAGGSFGLRDRPGRSSPGKGSFRMAARPGDEPVEGSRPTDTEADGSAQGPLSPPVLPGRLSLPGWERV